MSRIDILKEEIEDIKHQVDKKWLPIRIACKKRLVKRFVEYAEIGEAYKLSVFISQPDREKLNDFLKELGINYVIELRLNAYWLTMYTVPKPKIKNTKPVMFNPNMLVT